MTKQFIGLAATAVTLLTIPSMADARTNMRAVGSSTVYPFARIVSEKIGQANARLGTPIIEFDRYRRRDEAVLRRCRRALPGIWKTPRAA